MDGNVAAPCLTRYVALVIDVPNICTRGRKAEGTLERIQFEKLNWQLLLEEMRTSVGAERCEYLGGAYMPSPKGAERNQASAIIQEAILNAFGENGRNARVVGGERDIDSLITMDLFPNVIGLSRLQWQIGQPLPHEVTILLASGDHIYARAVNKLQRTFGRELLRVTLHTFSWRDQLSPELTGQSNKVFFLDDIPGLVPARK